MLSKEYELAIKIHDAALRIYQGKVWEYRARTIGDEEYLAARAVKVEADAAFDVAFELEQDWGQEPVEEDAPDDQLNLEI